MLQGMSAAVAVTTCGGRAFASEQRAWSSEVLRSLEQEAARLKLVAFIVRHNGRDVLSHGDVARVCPVHSMRKSFVSALFGQAVATGAIDIKLTLGDLGIDDGPALSEIEKRATIEDLLKARSGVYLPLQPGLTPFTDRPARGAYLPGAHWCYNNWDFNALGEIYRRLTHKGVFTAVAHNLAQPIGMRDFDPYRDGAYVFADDSLGGTRRYPNYRMSLSARDQAQFGQLYLQRGKWAGRQIIPEDWIARSFTSYSDTWMGGSAAGYGYLWWIGAVDGASSSAIRVRSAVGAFGHYVGVLPDLETVVVVQPDTDDMPSHPVSTDQYDALIRMIAAAHPGCATSGEKR
jgi:CubicO group peptidase (beta-lactamase class C family)